MPYFWNNCQYIQFFLEKYPNDELYKVHRGFHYTFAPFIALLLFSIIWSLYPDPIYLYTFHLLFAVLGVGLYVFRIYFIKSYNNELKKELKKEIQDKNERRKYKRFIADRKRTDREEADRIQEYEHEQKQIFEKKKKELAIQKRKDFLEIKKNQELALHNKSLSNRLDEIENIKQVIAEVSSKNSSLKDKVNEIEKKVVALNTYDDSFHTDYKELLSYIGEQKIIFSIKK